MTEDERRAVVEQLAAVLGAADAGLIEVEEWQRGFLVGVMTGLGAVPFSSQWDPSRIDTTVARSRRSPSPK